MTSEVSICNQALAMLGQAPITSLSDANVNAERCNALYAATRDAMLEAHAWRFATKRYALPQASPAPAFGYACRYEVPGEVLRVLEVNENKYAWELEEDSIVTDSSVCQMRAVSQVTDPNKFSSLFVIALATRLAAELAIAITGSRTLQDQLFGAYTKLKLPQATGINGNQGTMKRIRSSWLNDARLTGAGVSGPEV